MNLRKVERERLAALLEEGAETPELLAQLFVDALMELWAERLWHFGVHAIAGQAGIIGPFATQKQVEKALAITGADRAWVSLGRTAEGWARHVASVDAEPEPPKLNAKQEREQAKQFWAKAHAIREGDQLGLIAERGGVKVIDIKNIRDLT